MCRFAKETGYCPSGIQGSKKNLKIWCGDFYQQEVCGRRSNTIVSNEEINRRSTIAHSGAGRLTTGNVDLNFSHTQRGARSTEKTVEWHEGKHEGRGGSDDPKSS